MNKVIGKKIPVLAVLTLSLIVLNGCSSASTDENPAAGDPTQAAQPVAANAPTDVVPDDHNPEIELALAAGAVIVEPNTPSPVAAVPGGDPTVASAVPDPSAPVANPVDPGVNAAPANTTSNDMPTDTGTRTASTGKKHKSKGGHHQMSTAKDTPAVSADGKTYTVRNGDTLMKIAYDNYGNLYKWREIYTLNKAVIADPNHVPPGTTLQLSSGRNPASAVEHNGEQYMIQTGDTLGKISTNVYGTNDKWKKLWENNKQLIRDPNKIYAGFYLYYVPEGKKVSSTMSPDEDSNT